LSVDDYGTLTDGKLIVANVVVPPPVVTVKSSAGGQETKAVAVVSGEVGPAPEDRPHTEDDSASTSADTAVLINVLANDSATTLTPRLLGAPQHGTATLNADKTFTYMPSFAYAGADSFTYVASDATGADSNIATVTVDVSFTNHPPTANPDSVNTPVDRSVTFNVIDNDRDPDPNTAIVPSSVRIVSVSRGTAVANADGTITYTPVIEGTFTVQYTVADDQGAVSSAGTLTITVLSPDLARIVSGRYRADRGDWDIRGTTTVPGPGNQVTIHLGATLAGPVLAIIDSDVTGNWRWNPKGTSIAPDATQSISIESQQGGRQLGFVLRLD
jgi:Bacterial Ig domain